MERPSGGTAAVITGASGGIGRALCAGFRRNGYFIIGIDLNDDAAGLCDVLLNIDLNELVDDDKARTRGLERIRGTLGGRTVGALVNNAAVQILGGVDTLSAADWASTLNVNLLAPFFLAQGLLDLLEAAGGAVINIASIHARLTKPGFVAYATSKAALVGLTQSMAIDLGPRVRVNAIAPAAIETEMLKAGFESSPEAYQTLAASHPAERIGQPEEVAEVALFLASDKAGFMTGSVLALDGAVGARLHDPLQT